jgi:hypothetical protein
MITKMKTRPPTSLDQIYDICDGKRSSYNDDKRAT